GAARQRLRGIHVLQFLARLGQLAASARTLLRVLAARVVDAPLQSLQVLLQLPARGGHFVQLLVAQAAVALLVVLVGALLLTIVVANRGAQVALGIALPLRQFAGFLGQLVEALPFGLLLAALQLLAGAVQLFAGALLVLGAALLHLLQRLRHLLR